MIILMLGVDCVLMVMPNNTSIGENVLAKRSIRYIAMLYFSVLTTKEYVLFVRKHPPGKLQDDFKQLFIYLSNGHHRVHEYQTEQEPFR